jgi:RNA polymerase sigma-70 factor (ECF subfamily)
MPDSATDWADNIRKIADAGDKAAFAALFRHFAPRVKSFLIKRGANDTQADDAMQETMATVWHKAHMFDASKASAATWIFTIARNKFLDIVRKQSRPEPELLPDEPEVSESAEVAVNFGQEQELLLAAIRKLPPKQRDMIERAFLGDLSHAEISEATDLPLGTIKSRIRLGLERLRREIVPVLEERS